MSVKIADYIGTNAITIEHGETIYNLIKYSTDITLDFEGVNYSVPFANFIVGKLLEHRTLEKFNQQVKIVNLTEDWEYDFFQYAVKKANRYYRNANYRQAVDKVIEEMSQNDYNWN